MEGGREGVEEKEEKATIMLILNDQGSSNMRRVKKGRREGWRRNTLVYTTHTSWYCGGRTWSPGNSRQTTPTETLGIDLRRFAREEWSEGRRVARTVCVRERGQGGRGSEEGGGRGWEVGEGGEGRERGRGREERWKGEKGNIWLLIVLPLTQQ